MSIEEENKSRQQRVWEELFNKKNLGIVDELFTPEWVEHMPTGDIHGLDGAKQGPVRLRFGWLALPLYLLLA